ncbi:MAG: hypothetical protein M1828_002092 [Chrysothrix sp. TS-e1954]|nr:MAG: hypothetical protein M1828_002092 [Chrysothrix sp. TS-e1954]
MHNTLTRLQTVFSTFTTIAGLLALLIASTSLLTTPSPTLHPGSLKLHNVQVVKGRPHIYTSRKEEYAHVKFDLDVDLSDLFGWNTKQVFLYVTASYPPDEWASKPVMTHGGERRETGEPDPESETGSGDAAEAGRPQANAEVDDELSSDLPTNPLNTKAIIWDAILPHPLFPPHTNQYRFPQPPSSSNTKPHRKVSAKSARQSAEAFQAAARLHPGILRLTSQRPKYQITDPSGKLARRANASLELAWNIQPWVGALSWGSGNAALGASSSGLHSGAVRDRSGLQGLVGWLVDFRADRVWSTWRSVGGKGGAGARSGWFEFPGLKDQREAARRAGEQGELRTEKGAEGHKLMAG